ncbi:MAG: HD domain-containing protein [Deltaproteobacteria bacterium]|jgi:poly(A) polymerase|nr:HD domain-containing protein [Deltaproteobacteria bacterium]
MSKAIKDAVGICKTLLRNGYDAHVVNAQLQQQLRDKYEDSDVDIACETDFESLARLFPDIERDSVHGALAVLKEEGVVYRFYPINLENASHPELSLLRITPRMTHLMSPQERLQLRLHSFGSPQRDESDPSEGFQDFSCGQVRLVGLQDRTLRSNYLLAIRALRFAANHDLPVGPNTWLAIVRSASRVLDYVPVGDIMDEWRKVHAARMWRFIQLLYDAHILQGLIPEVAALSCLQHEKNDAGELETVFQHTIECVRRYPEDDFRHDWLGALSMLFHDVGKLYTGEFFMNKWSFYQHHRVGAKVTSKILRSLHFLPDDIDLICHLVRYHMRFQFMLTDRGIRRFRALDEYPRLMQMTLADIKARNSSTTNYNHNQKYLDRAETDAIFLEPLLNGKQIMEYVKLSPGPLIGALREALLMAQVAGEVTDEDGAIAFVIAKAQNTTA